MPDPAGPIKVIIPEAEQKTRAANFVQVSVNAEEFLVHFVHIDYVRRTGIAQARLSLPPRIAKEMMKALGRMIDSYEKKFGDIRPPEEPEPKIGFDLPGK